MTLAGLVVALAVSPAPPEAGPRIDHLPSAVQEDISAWRARLAEARCLRIECRTEETWSNLHVLDGDGSPAVIARERFRVESWMTPGALWASVTPLTERDEAAGPPAIELYWDAARGRAWQRIRPLDGSAAESCSFECTDPAELDIPMIGSNGCIYATGLQTWLAGAGWITACESAKSAAFLRGAYLALTPPDAEAPGLWLDVFREAISRDDDPAPESLYRRQDFMRLARDVGGKPVLAEWRTLVLTDESSGGLRPQQITGIRRFSFEFLDSLPARTRADIDAFIRDIEPRRP